MERSSLRDGDKRSASAGERKRRNEKDEVDEDQKSRRRPSKNPVRDSHRRHLEKLMEHPDRPVPIPESSKDRKPPEPPDFVRFYMGSSAGAGSEVFHVYRHLRRRENDRQDYISSKAEEEKLEEEFQQTVAVHRAEDDARTAKKRAKRLKRKQRQRLAKKVARLDETGGEARQQQGEGEGEGGEQSSSSNDEEQHFIIGGK